MPLKQTQARPFWAALVRAQPAGPGKQSSPPLQDLWALQSKKALAYWMSKSSGGYWWLEQRSAPDLTMFSNSPKGRYKENTVSLFLKGKQYDKNKEAAAMKIQIINEENILHEVVKHGNRGLKKFWSLHPCRYSKPNWMWSSATCLQLPCSKQEIGLDNRTVVFQPELSQKITYLDGRSQKADQRRPRRQETA